MTRTLVVLLLLSLAGNLCLGYLVLDASVALDDAYSAVDQLQDRGELALEIMRGDWIRRPAREVDELARELEAAGSIVGREGEIREIGDFLFYVEDGIVVDVQDLDSGVEPAPR